MLRGDCVGSTYFCVQLQAVPPTAVDNGDTVVLNAPPVSFDLGAGAATAKRSSRRTSSRSGGGAARTRAGSGASGGERRPGYQSSTRATRRSVAASDASPIAEEPRATVPMIDVDIARVNAAAVVLAREEEEFGRYVRNGRGRLVPEASLFDNVALASLADADEEAIRWARVVWCGVKTCFACNVGGCIVRRAWHAAAGDSEALADVVSDATSEEEFVGGAEESGMTTGDTDEASLPSCLPPAAVPRGAVGPRHADYSPVRGKAEGERRGAARALKSGGFIVLPTTASSPGSPVLPRARQARGARLAEEIEASRRAIPRLREAVQVRGRASLVELSCNTVFSCRTLALPFKLRVQTRGCLPWQLLLPRNTRRVDLRQ